MPWRQACYWGVRAVLGVKDTVPMKRILTQLALITTLALFIEPGASSQSIVTPTLTGITPVGIPAGLNSAAASATGPAEWPQWRGPDGRAISGETGLPLSWSDTENLAWKVEIEGRGHSSPSVWGNRLFLTTAMQGEEVPGAEPPVHTYAGEVFLHPDSMGANFSHTLKVVAFDATTGEKVWDQVAYEGRVFDDRHRMGSYANSTVATDGEYVYAYFGPEGLYCYDFDGNLVWQAEVGKTKTVGLGTGTSPVIYEDLVIITADEDEGADSFIVALDRFTGEEVWKEPRSVQASWATPLLVVDPNDRTQLVVSGNELSLSYDPATGEELWRAQGLRSHAIHTPLAAGEMIYLTSGFPRKVLRAFSLGDYGDLGESDSLVWEYNKGMAYVTSNIVYGGHVYLFNDGGVVTCLDALTGEIVYEGGRPPVPGSFKSSPVAYDGKILIASEEGDLFVIKAGPEFEVLATNSMNEVVWASPAISNGKIYIRGDRHLFAVGQAQGNDD